MSRILLTGGRAPVALELARLFAAAGDTVFVADSARYFLARSSRVIADAYQVPPPRYAPRAFAEAIASIVTRERITRVVPTCEEVFYLAAFADRLRPLTELFCPSLDVLRSLHDKWIFSELAGSLGFDVPETWHLESASDLNNLPVAPSELVFKPAFSRFAVQTLVQPARVQLARLNPTPDHPWVAQRFIAGRELCTYSVACAGNLTAHLTYAPTWRAGRGSSFYFSPVECPAIEALVAGVAARLHYTGQLVFDCIQRPDQTISVLECNPRATSGVHLFAAADGLRAAFDGILSRGSNVIHPRSPQPSMLASAMVLVGLRRAVRTGNLRQFVADFRRARDVIWSPTDPAPAAYVFAGLVDYLRVARRHHISPMAASTLDIEWDGQPIR
jgi:hypothetical protein